MINFKKLIKNFGFAFVGLKKAASEQTFRIFIMAAVLVIVLMFVFDVSHYEKLMLVLIITIVVTLELINSRIERILDIFQPDYDERVRIIKDISAGAVLLACLGAAIIGFLIFWPYFQNLFFLGSLSTIKVCLRFT